MMSNLVGVAVLAVVGLGVAALVMYGCARLAGVEQATVRGTLLAAAGFGLPLAAVSAAWSAGEGVVMLLALLGAVVMGVGIIRAAYHIAWGKALLIWFLNVCASILVFSLVMRRG